MKKAYKFRAYPTQPQQGRANRLLAAHWEIYNEALAERRDAWDHGVRVNYGTQSAQLKEVRADDCRPDLAVWSFSAQQQTLRRLNRAFEAFFARCRKGQTPGYPRFRSLARFDTVDHVNGDGAKWAATEGRWARAYFKGVGHVKVSEHTPIPDDARVTQISIKREHGGRRWYVIVVAEHEAEPLPVTGRSVGIDVGVARFLTTSDCEVVDNPRWLETSADDLADLQRQLARCKRGSGNYRRKKRQIARLHRKVANRRRDFHHKTARALVDSCDEIAIEDLKVANMTRSAAGTIEKPGRNVAAKSGLNRVILDAGWAQFAGILEAKVRQHEPTRTLTRVNPAYTSINCSYCGTRCTRPEQDTVVCPEHGELDADHNGAVNIYIRAGLGSVEPSG